MANKNKRTKARREKETKEAQHKKVVEKPIYKRPWIWIALAALVIAIVVPSAYQGIQQLQQERAAAEAEADAKKELEPAIWESVLPALAEMGVEESAVTEKTFDIVASVEGGAYDYARVSVTTAVRTVIAMAYYSAVQSDLETTDGAADVSASEGVWTCMQIANDDGSHIYWSVFNQGIENATQAAIYGEDGTITSQPLYDYTTDEPVKEVTGAAVETAPETTDGAAETTTDPAASEDAQGESAEEVG